MTKIKMLVLATGDIYNDALFEGTTGDLLELVEKRAFMTIIADKHRILINGDFIVSLEF